MKSKSDNLHILGIGNPLLDIQSPVTQSFLDENNLKMNNAILVTPEQLPLFEKLKSHKDVKYIAGGSTLNSIRVCQWILNDSRPGCTTYMGCVGEDENGELLRKSAEKDGVKTCFMVDGKSATGVCGVGILKKERTLFTNLAAANNFKVDFLEKHKNVYENADIIYISGYFLTVSIDSILMIGKHCAEQNKPLAINISANFIPEFFKENLEKAIRYSDYIIMNEIEAKAFSKHVLGKEELSLAEIAKEMAVLPKENHRRKRIIIITCGKGSTIANEGGDVLININVPQLQQSKVVDLNGAGDAFLGGLLSQMASGGNIIDCIKVGHRAARHIVQESGVSLSTPFTSDD